MFVQALYPWEKGQGIRPFCKEEFYDYSDSESDAPEEQVNPPQPVVEEEREERAQNVSEEDESDLEDGYEDPDHPGEDEDEDEDDETSYDPEYGDSQAYSP